MTYLKKLTAIIAVALFAVAGLTGCENEEMTRLQSANSELSTANKQLAATNGMLMTQLSLSKAENARLTTQLADARQSAQAERDAKWRARNEVVGAQKVAKSAVKAAQAAGVKQASAKPTDRRR